MIVVKRKNRTELLSIRLTQEEKQLLTTVAEQDGMKLSTWIRMVINEHLENNM